MKIAYICRADRDGGAPEFFVYYSDHPSEHFWYRSRLEAAAVVDTDKYEIVETLWRDYVNMRQTPAGSMGEAVFSL
jgi:hypothetical protein